MTDRPALFTVGHSTHPIETFLDLLAAHRIAILVDVRSYPSSRRWPQFYQAQLQASLREKGFGYVWCRSLGGRRTSARTDSPHTAWQHPAFRAYADYCDTPDFKAGLAELTDTARDARVAIMCSEGLWWRCHRRIVADHLTMFGWEAIHIMPNGSLSTHSLPEFATITDSLIVYDGGQQTLKLK